MRYRAMHRNARFLPGSIRLHCVRECRHTWLMPIPRDFSRPAVRRAWIDALLGPLPERRWEEMVCELFVWQYARVPAFRRLCEGHGVSPATLRSWRDIPAMPQQLFKRAKLFAHGDAKPAAIYETSGTTTGEPGRQHLLRTDIYQAVCVAGARRMGLDDAPEFHFIAASPRSAPHSSLSAMFGFWNRAAAQNGTRFWMGADDFAKLRDVLARSRRPIALCGTAFGFVHFLDSLSGNILPLPSGSRLLETGGFKGRSREVPKPELYAQLARTFRVPDRAIWNEYGMSELSSQAYARGLHGLHAAPPWARLLVVDPATGREVAPGREGLVRWIDLANVDSVMALQTLDRAQRAANGFRLIGRLPRTEPRGCSLGAEDLLATSTSINPIHSNAA
jgi:phenylacetate-coenzyme A ligase PaaK-like adenylate-forming protein